MTLLRKQLSRVRRDRLLYFLLFLNVVVSSLIICFSYGLYQNYHAVLNEGQNQEFKELSIRCDPKYECKLSGYDLTVVDITISEIKSFMLALDNNTSNNIDYCCVRAKLENNIYLPCDKEGYFIEGKDKGLYDFLFLFSANDGVIVPAEKELAYDISLEDYTAGKKLLYVDDRFYGDDASFGEGYSNNHFFNRELGENDTTAIVNGSEYRLVKNYDHNLSPMWMPITAADESAKIDRLSKENDEYILICFKDPLTREQYEDIKQAASATFREKAIMPEIRFTDVTELYYYRTVMLISVIISLLTALNMAILYRYIFELRSRELSIMRICGCPAYKAVLRYLSECLVVNLPLFALSEYVYHKLLMPRFAENFEHFSGAYSKKIYLAIFVIYASASLLLMLIMSVRTVRSHNINETRSRPKSRSFGIMKLFEILQLTAVLVMTVSMCSTMISRYALYKPFKDILSGKGYVFTTLSQQYYPKDLRDQTYSAEMLNTCIGGYYLPEHNEMIDTINYSQELIERYSPELSEGIWLSESEDSYRSNGIMPIVVTASSRYKVGDSIVVPSYEKAWDENGKPTDYEDIVLKVTGKLEENTSVLSFVDPLKEFTAPHDHRDLYGVLNSEYENKELFLMRMNDMYDFCGAESPVRGVQFIDCSDMTDEQFKLTGIKLNGMQNSFAVSYEAINDGSRNYIFQQIYTILPIIISVFALALISAFSISAIYTKRHLHDYAVLYICGATWRSCALRSLRSGLITCGAAVLLTAAVLVTGKLTFMKETVISFGLIPLAICAGVLTVYLALSMIMPLLIIGRTEPREILKEE